MTFNGFAPYVIQAKPLKICTRQRFTVIDYKWLRHMCTLIGISVWTKRSMHQGSYLGGSTDIDGFIDIMIEHKFLTQNFPNQYIILGFY